eukprot:COSAG02_NODE_2931_length_7716_cov_3.042536_2_plen_49_part_00
MSREKLVWMRAEHEFAIPTGIHICLANADKFSLDFTIFENQTLENFFG